MQKGISLNHWLLHCIFSEIHCMNKLFSSGTRYVFYTLTYNNNNTSTCPLPTFKILTAIIVFRKAPSVIFFVMFYHNEKTLFFCQLCVFLHSLRFYQLICMAYCFKLNSVHTKPTHPLFHFVRKESDNTMGDRQEAFHFNACISLQCKTLLWYACTSFEAQLWLRLQQLTYLALRGRIFIELNDPRCDLFIK